jgi:hypothetical protein
MSIHNALIFIEKVDINPDFRKLCNQCGEKERIQDTLKVIKMNFEDWEFEDAINHRLVQCQTYEQADVFQQLRQWYKCM